MNSSIQSISTSDLLESEGFQTNARFLCLLLALWLVPVAEATSLSYPLC